MPERDAGAERQVEFAAVLRAASTGAYKAVYLFVGEPFETRPAAQALIDLLVPEARRAFNLETYDGRGTALSHIVDSLRTPGFFPGAKVVWIRESTVFVSGEKRPDITAALFRAWNEGRAPDAADKLLTLVALAGWKDDQFRETRWAGIAKTRLREVFGVELEAEQLTQLQAVHAACVARDLRLEAYRDDGAALIDLLDAGMPAQAVLLCTASAVDARKRICKRIRDLGVLIDFSSARERSGALSRDAVDDLVRRIVGQAGKRLEPQAHELILRRAGSDAAILATELEQLCLYVGDQPAITADAVRAVFRDMAESWIFDFTSALAGCQLAQAFPLLRGLLAQGEPPLRLLAMVARELRLLLIARECLDDALAGTWRAEVNFGAFQARILPQLDPATREAFGNVHPYALYRRFQDAARVRGKALRRALIRLSEIDWQLKTSRSDPALLLEGFVLDWCRSGRGAAQPACVA
ncbi:MAG: DNA polymerase III subunit delta [Candidatus Binatia bacterium]